MTNAGNRHRFSTITRRLLAAAAPLILLAAAPGTAGATGAVIADDRLLALAYDPYASALADRGEAHGRARVVRAPDAGPRAPTVTIPEPSDATDSQSPPDPEHARASSIYGFLGYGTQALGDVNDDIADDEQAFQGVGFPVSFDPLGGALDIGVGLSIPVGTGASLGFEVGYQSNSVHHQYSDATGSIGRDIDLQVVDVGASLALHLPSTPAVFLGGMVGVALATGTHDWSYRDVNESSNDANGQGDLEGSGFAAGAFLGYEQAMGSGLMRVVAGYRHRNVGEMSGVYGGTEGFGSGSYADNSGRAVDFDFSGVFARLVLGFRIGG